MLPPIPQVLPVVTVQPTLGEVLHEVQEGIIPLERVWISCYKNSEPSVHGKYIAVLDNVDRDLVTLSKEEPGIEFDFIGNGNHGHEFKASCPSLGIPETKILLPSQEYNNLDRTNTKRPQPITAFDVSPDVSRFAVGYGDGSIFVYPTSSIPGKPSFLQHKPPASQSKVSTRPHVSEVTTLKFFPSSRVLLTGGLDFSLSIVSAELPDPAPNAEPQKVEPVRTFRGHSRSVTGTAILGPGRNFLSSSADSTVKLWDAPSGTTINTIFASSRSPILSISLGSRLSRYADATTATHRDEREAQEVADKGVFCGLGNGSFELLDLSTKSSVYQSPTTSTAPISSIAYSSDIHLLATGAGNGRRGTLPIWRSYRHPGDRGTLGSRSRPATGFHLRPGWAQMVRSSSTSSLEWTVIRYAAFVCEIRQMGMTSALTPQPIEFVTETLLQGLGVMI
ncbi:ribosome assembly protein 4 [Coprinopsis cinerea AmutBmut pab1-1]|nr:ribosome assembly protein 4 [Coprinopsis cinerea AmutBmut pab1-1]